MRILPIAAALALVALPALADLTSGESTTGRSPGPPLDRGAPGGASGGASDGAYSGGGVVLQGAPGAPAPPPLQTAPAGSGGPSGMPAR